jgi:hypothetical protein
VIGRVRGKVFTDGFIAPIGAGRLDGGRHPLPVRCALERRARGRRATRAAATTTAAAATTAAATTAVAGTDAAIVRCAARETAHAVLDDLHLAAAIATRV